jgi:hypothetical protein
MGGSDVGTKVGVMLGRNDELGEARIEGRTRCDSCQSHGDGEPGRDRYSL